MDEDIKALIERIAVAMERMANVNEETLKLSRETSMVTKMMGSMVSRMETNGMEDWT